MLVARIPGVGGKASWADYDSLAWLMEAPDATGIIASSHDESEIPGAPELNGFFKMVSPRIRKV